MIEFATYGQETRGESSKFTAGASIFQLEAE